MLRSVFISNNNDLCHRGVKLGMPRAVGEKAERDRSGKRDREEGRRLHLHDVTPPWDLPKSSIKSTKLIKKF